MQTAVCGQLKTQVFQVELYEKSKNYVAQRLIAYSL